MTHLINHDLLSLSIIVTVEVPVSSVMTMLGSEEVRMTVNVSVNSKTLLSRIGMLKKNSVVPATKTTSVLITSA